MPQPPKKKIGYRRKIQRAREYNRLRREQETWEERRYRQEQNRIAKAKRRGTYCSSSWTKKYFFEENISGMSHLIIKNADSISPSAYADMGQSTDTDTASGQTFNLCSSPVTTQMQCSSPQLIYRASPAFTNQPLSIAPQIIMGGQQVLSSVGSQGTSQIILGASPWVSSNGIQMGPQIILGPSTGSSQPVSQFIYSPQQAFHEQSPTVSPIIYNTSPVITQVTSNASPLTSIDATPATRIKVEPEDFPLDRESSCGQFSQDETILPDTNRKFFSTKRKRSPNDNPFKVSYSNGIQVNTEPRIETVLSLATVKAKTCEVVKPIVEIINKNAIIRTYSKSVKDHNFNAELSIASDVVRCARGSNTRSASRQLPKLGRTEDFSLNDDISAFVCNLCEEKYNEKRKTKKKGALIGSNEIRCVDCQEKVVFSTIQKLREHLSQVHNQDMIQLCFNLTSMKEFQAWKTQYENETDSLFVCRCINKCAGHKTFRYSCHRNGFVTGRAPTGTKDMIPETADRMCSAFITVTEWTKMVQVVAGCQHYRHEGGIDDGRFSKDNCITFSSTMNSEKTVNENASTPSPKEPEATIACTFCKEMFSSRLTLGRHQRRKHSLTVAKNNAIKCTECTEPVHFRLLKQLRNHLEAAHGRDMRQESFVLPSLQGFLIWKRLFQKGTNSFYVLKKRRLKDECMIYQYNCHKSGTSLAKGKKQGVLKSPVSQKSNPCCTSYIICKVGKEKISVELGRQHYGHEKYTCHMGLSQEGMLSIILRNLQNGYSSKTNCSLSNSSSVKGKTNNLQKKNNTAADSSHDFPVPKVGNSTALLDESLSSEIDKCLNEMQSLTQQKPHSNSRDLLPSLNKDNNNLDTSGIVMEKLQNFLNVFKTNKMKYTETQLQKMNAYLQALIQFANIEIEGKEQER